MAEGCDSLGSSESVEALREIVPVRIVNFRTWQRNASAVQFLQAVQQHRPVLLIEHIGPDVDREVGVHAEDVRVVGAVVDGAQRQATGNRPEQLRWFGVG